MIPFIRISENEYDNFLDWYGDKYGAYDSEFVVGFHKINVFDKKDKRVIAYMTYNDDNNNDNINEDNCFARWVLYNEFQKEILEKE